MMSFWGHSTDAPASQLKLKANDSELTNPDSSLNLDRSEHQLGGILGDSTGYAGTTFGGCSNGKGQWC